jgi:hypothetical protein
LFRRKETDPTFSLRALIEALHKRFDVSFTDTVAISRQYATYVGHLPAQSRVLIRYEDFLASKLDNHPLRHLFVGSREVGSEYQRTRRSGDAKIGAPSSRRLIWLGSTRNSQLRSKRSATILTSNSAVRSILRIARVMSSASSRRP